MFQGSDNSPSEDLSYRKRTRAILSLDSFLTPDRNLFKTGTHRPLPEANRSHESGLRLVFWYSSSAEGNPQAAGYFARDFPPFPALMIRPTFVIVCFSLFWTNQMTQLEPSSVFPLHYGFPFFPHVGPFNLRNRRTIYSQFVFSSTPFLNLWVMPKSPFFL